MQAEGEQVSAANKARGSRFENDTCDWLQAEGIRAKRLPRTGAKDIGDAAFPLQGTGTLVLELKNRKQIDLAQFVKEAELESIHYEMKYPSEAPAFGCAVVKRRQKSIGESYVVFTLEEFTSFMRHVSAV